jgi:hypothetical protein
MLLLALQQFRKNDLQKPAAPHGYVLVELQSVGYSLSVTVVTVTLISKFDNTSS